jgi:cell division protein FtsI (penicillin-binding protein 3)
VTGGGDDGAERRPGRRPPGSAGRSGQPGRPAPRPRPDRGARPSGPPSGGARRGPGSRPGSRTPGARPPGARPPAGGRPARPGPAPRSILLRRNPGPRLNAGLVVTAVVLSLFAGRLVQMQGLDSSHYRTLANEERAHTVSIPTLRGSITTSDGLTLAMTIQTDQVTADPQEIPPADRAQVARQLASPLGMTPAAILNLLNHPPAPQWVQMPHTVSASAGSRIADLGLPGITLQPSYQRSYPNANLASSLVGFTDPRPDGSTQKLVGEAGLEYEYNRLLSGRDGSERVELGATNEPIPGTETSVTQPVPARSLRLTIQSSIQYEAERACAAQVRETRARNCSIVVMDPHTGAILAMAQYPTFNPNQPITTTTPTSNIAVTNVFSPGSTLKPLTVAAALEKGGQTPLSTYTVPDSITVHGYTFHDAEPHPTLRYTIAGILANSLNDGMVQVVQHITPLQQYNYLRAFGLGRYTGVDLPGESPGLLYRPGTANYSGVAGYYGDEPYELSFGQGIGVTAIQMATIYATIANGGVRVQPSVIAGTTSAAGRFTPAPAPAARRVIQAQTAHQLMTMMEQVPYVDEAQDEPWGVISGYLVASKTGTAQVSDPKLGKCLCQYGSSYIGIAPAQAPRLVVAVNIQDPTAHGYYGDEIAGPVFYKVMKFALRALRIPPSHARAPYIRLTRP